MRIMLNTVRHSVMLQTKTRCDVAANTDWMVQQSSAENIMSIVTLHCFVVHISLTPIEGYKFDLLIVHWAYICAT